MNIATVARVVASLVLIMSWTPLSCGGDSPSGTANGLTDCASIANAYASSVAQARTCDPAKADSCSASRPAALQDVCKCMAAVNPVAVAELDQLAARYQSQGCAKPGTCTRLCKRPDNVCAGAPSMCR